MCSNTINRCIISLITVFVCFSIINIPSAFAQDEIVLDIKPNEVLFDVDNMKPGDWAPRTVIVQNNGSKAFNYVTTLQPAKQSMKLFNELLLEVEDSRGELYNGRLADFKQLKPRELNPSKEEEISFTVRFPVYLGNEFQGLDANFILRFSAEGNDNKKDEKAISGTISGAGGSPGASAAGTVGSGFQLPATASNMFNIMLVGLLILGVGGSILLYKKRKTDT
jgi:LPXTG-motif cell wall-anchored protein